ncbi:MAG: DinB family protein [Dehalococcoidia bacterium]
MAATKQDFAQAVRAFIDRAESMASSLSPADWQKTVYEDGWNAKQVFCHLAAMAGSAPFIINIAASAPPPSGGGQGGFDVDAWNAREVAARQDKPIEEILGELKTGYARSVEAVEATSDELLAKRVTMPWGVSGTLAEIVVGSVTGHGAEHLDDVERALRGR